MNITSFHDFSKTLGIFFLSPGLFHAPKKRFQVFHDRTNPEGGAELTGDFHPLLLVTNVRFYGGQPGT